MYWAASRDGLVQGLVWFKGWSGSRVGLFKGLGLFKGWAGLRVELVEGLSWFRGWADLRISQYLVRTLTKEGISFFVIISWNFDISRRQVDIKISNQRHC